MNQLTDRIGDNFSGALTAPANIDPAGSNSFTFMVVGDTHVGSPQGATLNSFAQVAQDAGDAFIIVAGDLSDDGTEGEFNQFKQTMSDHNMTWRAAIGNHDIFFGGWNNYRSLIGRSIYSFNADNVHFVMLDTANGVLGKTQLEWLENDLKANTQTHTILVTHFAPWNGSFSSIYRMSSEEEAAILKDMAYRYNVSFVFSGHYHGYEDMQLGRTRYIVTGGANSRLDIGQKSNYVRVTVSGGSITAQSVFP